MTLYEYYESITRSDLESFIVEKQSENLRLEFKTVNHPNYNAKNAEYDRKNLSEACSGFANSDGGIVIWGVKADKGADNIDVARELREIRELTNFINFLNRTEGQCIIPTVTGIEHRKIETSADVGFVKTYIPKSDSAPHMALFSGKHYYKRSGDSFYRCEHYDIADMFHRKKTPSLELKIHIEPYEKYTQLSERYKFIVSIHNSGASLARFPYLAFNCNQPYFPSQYGLNNDGRCGLEKVTSNISYRYNYSGGINTVIYPGTRLDVDRLVAEVSNHENLNDLKLDYTLSAENMPTTTSSILIDLRTIIDTSWNLT